MERKRERGIHRERECAHRYIPHTHTTKRQNATLPNYERFAGLRYTVFARAGTGVWRGQGMQSRAENRTTLAAEGVEPAARSVKSAMQLSRLRSSDTNASHDSTHLLKSTLHSLPDTTHARKVVVTRALDTHALARAICDSIHLHSHVHAPMHNSFFGKKLCSLFGKGAAFRRRQLSRNVTHQLA